MRPSASRRARAVASTASRGYAESPSHDLAAATMS